MANYENKRAYNNIKPKEGEQLVPILAYDLLKWENDSVRNGLASPGQLVNKENLETWALCSGHRRVLVGFVAVPNDQAEAAIKAFWLNTNEYIEDTRSKRCLITNKKGELIRCPKSNKCGLCDQQYNPERITSREISYTKLMEDTGNNFNIASTTNDIDFQISMMIIDDLISKVSKKYPEANSILHLIMNGYTKKEIIEEVNIKQLKKTQAYDFIKKIESYAEEIYNKDFR